MKHKWHSMIVAKSANMDLVVFINNYGKWEISDFCQLVELEELPAFLCLPQHKDACLHWLNGGHVEVRDLGSDEWVNLLAPGNGNSGEWTKTSIFMTSDVESRIKPRKEKRWITYNPKSREVYNCGKSQIPAKGFQIIEIEIDIEV